MLGKISPNRLDKTGSMLTRSTADARGEKTETWGSAYDFKFAWLPPLRGNDSFTGSQPESTQKYSALIRKEDRTITAKDNRFTFDGETYHIQAVRPYKGSRNFLVLDSILKDVPV